MKNIDLMIVGAQKSATSTLKTYLSEHISISSHSAEEFSFFGNEVEYFQGYNKAYKKYFDINNNSSSNVIVAKYVGIYQDEKKIKRLFDHNKDCKIVFIIREPVSRAFSSFNFEKFYGFKGKFSDLKKILNNNDQNNPMYKFFIKNGLYYEHLNNMYKYFSKDQIKIFLYEDFIKNPTKICEIIFSWLNIDSKFKPNIKKQYNKTYKSNFLGIIFMKFKDENNVIKKLFRFFMPKIIYINLSKLLLYLSKSSRSLDQISEEMHNILYEYYLPHNKKLEELTRINLEKWKK